MVLEKTLESPLDCKEIQPVNAKGDQFWKFIGSADAEAETPILCPPDVKNWLTRKNPDAGKDWRVPAFPVSLFICPVIKAMMGVLTVVSAAPKYEEPRAQTYEVYFSWNSSWGLQQDPAKPQASDAGWIYSLDVSVVILKEMATIILASTPPPILPNIHI